MCIVPGFAVGRAQQRVVTVDDCVSIRRVVDGPLLSPSGKEVAFVVKNPDVGTNQNQYELRVKRTTPGVGSVNGRVILRSSGGISKVQWLGDGVHLAALIDQNFGLRKASRIVLVDSRSSRMSDVTVAGGALDYTASSDGNAMAYLTSVVPQGAARPSSDPIKETRGFYVPSGYSSLLLGGKGAVRLMKSAIWLVQKSVAHPGWSKRSLIPFPDAPGAAMERGEFNRVTAMSMSPNGQYIAIAYELQAVIEPWASNRTVMAYRNSYSANPIVLGLYDVAAGKFVNIPRVPFPRAPIWWASDSSSFAVVGASPLGSRWESEDIKANTDPKGASSFHIFAIEVLGMRLSRVLGANMIVQGVTAVSWNHGNTEMNVELSRGESFHLARSRGEWAITSRLGKAIHFDLSDQVTVDGQHFVGLHEEPTVPPDLWSVDQGSNQKPIRLTNLNPQINGLDFGEGKDISWMNKYGGEVSGRLLTPSTTLTEAPYPLVIMLTWPDKRFVCDAQYTTAFPPIPLVDAGFAVVMFNVYDSYAGSTKPAGPPLVEEANSTVASVEALVDYLQRLGIASRDNIGIIGFSRSSWKLDYLLTHSDLKLRAASSADGGIGNYGGAFIYDGGSPAAQLATGYGGSFYASRSEWLSGAPAFNADKVKTPLLMEYTGGTLQDEPLSAYEFQSALVGLNKPVELFFYPRGDHPLDTPFERVASLQRNVDWFRFWMQGKEAASPSYDPDQFDRWRKLRGLQETSGDLEKTHNR